MLARRIALSLATAALSGCGAAPAALHSATAAVSAAGGQPRKGAAVPPTDESAVPSWRLTLQPTAASGRLRVTIETSPLEVRHWLLPSEKVERLEAHDADGPIGLSRRAGAQLEEAQSGGRHLDLEPKRPLHAPVSLSYEIAQGRRTRCPFELTPDRAVFCGAAVLAMPDDRDGVRPIELHLVADGDFYRAAASSFGLSAVSRIEASFTQLGRAGFLFGDVHTARFDAHEGRDHAAWLGYISFDPRWVAAEAAGVRTAVDRWLAIKRPQDDPTAGLLVVGVRDTSPFPTISALHRGAMIEAGPSAAWSVRARLDLTRLLVQRTVGGAITLDHLGARWWFDEGIAHAVALLVLTDMGVLTLEEAATEVSSWLAEEALSKRAGSSLDELTAIAAGPAEGAFAARRLLAIRGAVLGLGLAGSSAEGLKRALRHTLEQGDAAGRGSTDAFFAAAAGGPQTVRSAFESGRPIPLAEPTLSPCLALVVRRIHRFELGFTSRSDSKGEARVDTVDPSGPAARAGVREGDTIVSLEHVPDRSDLPAYLDLRRHDGTVHVRYLPRGPSRLGRALTVASRAGVCALGG